jgi:hypothetical protein
MVLLKLTVLGENSVPSKHLAAELCLSPSEITQSMKRCRASGLLSWSNVDRRVNRAGLSEFLIHGFRYVFPAQTGSLTRGIPTSFAAEPLKSQLKETGEPPPVWPYADGKVRGISFSPLHRRAPEAAMRDPNLYQLLTLVDGLRGSRVRERQIAAEELEKRLKSYA